MARTRDLSPAGVAPLFGLLTLVFAAAVLSRFDGFAAQIPAQAHATALWVSFPLILIAGAVEGRVDHGTGMEGSPLWMRIDSRPVRWTFTLALTYFELVALEGFEVSLGAIDPRAPEGWPLAQRLLWFVGLSFGMSFANFLAAAGALIPGLRVLTAPFSRLAWGLGLVLLVVIGLGLGAGALEVLAHAPEIRASVAAKVSQIWQRE